MSSPGPYLQKTSIPANLRARLRRPGLGAVALIGALSWAAALWIGPWLMPGPGPAKSAALDFERELDPVSAVMALKPTDAMAENRPRPVVRKVEVRRGDTLMELLVGARIPRREAHAAITALRKVFDPRDLVPGMELSLTFQPLTAEAHARRSFRGFSFKPDVTRTISVARSWNNGFAARLAKTKLARTQVRAEGTIETSLYVDAANAGVPLPAVIEMIRAFSFEIDFQRDIRPGDRFEILFEDLRTPDGASADTGDMIYASMTVRGKRRPLYRFKTRDGIVDYYNDKGESVKRMLMRTPVDGARLSSRYGRRRHPILGYTKMHRGIDFAAPTGTPIMAAGRGIVVAAGRNGGYGRYVRIRHNSTYQTAYAHMSRFARGIRRGRRVSQGQVIGYVGSTGRSTGPHLHYEILRNNRQINPLGLKLPTGRRLRGRELAKFQTLRAGIDAAYANLPILVAQGEQPHARRPRTGETHRARHEQLGTGGP